MNESPYLRDGPYREAAVERWLLDYQDGKITSGDCLLMLTRIINNVVVTAVAQERQRCARIAWKMQMEQFGGGTAIGNAITES